MDTFFSSAAATAAATTAGTAAGTTAAQACQMQTQNAAPTTGQTVAMPNDDKDRTLVLAPAGALPALTVTFPSDASSRIGQIIRITSTQAITTFSIAGGVTVANLVTTFTANGLYSYQKTAANTWTRLQ